MKVKCWRSTSTVTSSSFSACIPWEARIPISHDPPPITLRSSRASIALPSKVPVVSMSACSHSIPNTICTRILKFTTFAIGSLAAEEHRTSGSPYTSLEIIQDNDKPGSAATDVLRNVALCGCIDAVFTHLGLPLGYVTTGYKTRVARGVLLPASKQLP
ncbi:hypothetical protein GY45DRAFT_125076 [Cubamyces sp. BRFM 1775]|nr:hypothetical protein GY45DRAFT_125076 [Cubamyces sp. BRFM 1775]